MSTERLLEIRKQIKKAETEQAELKGQISGVEQSLKDDFKVNSLSDAETKLKSMGKDLDKMEAAFNKGLKTLEEAYAWN